MITVKESECGCNGMPVLTFHKEAPSIIVVFSFDLRKEMSTMKVIVTANIRAATKDGFYI